MPFTTARRRSCAAVTLDRSPSAATLKLYLRKPMTGEVGSDGKPRKWRLDMFECPALLPNQPPADDETIEFYQGQTVDRAERTVPADILRQYDLDVGLTCASLAARSA